MTVARDDSGARPAGVDGDEHVLRGGAVDLVEVEREALTAAEQPVDAALQPDLVGLQPVAQPGLGDATAVLELDHEVTDLVVEVLTQVGREPGRDAAEEDAAEARRRVAGELDRAERDPSRGSDRPREEALEFGQDHGAPYRQLARRLQPAGVNRRSTDGRAGARPEGSDRTVRR